MNGTFRTAPGSLFRRRTGSQDWTPQDMEKTDSRDRQVNAHDSLGSPRSPPFFFRTPRCLQLVLIGVTFQTLASALLLVLNTNIRGACLLNIITCSDSWHPPAFSRAFGSGSAASQPMPPPTS